MAAPADPLPADRLPALAAAFDFTGDELAANRAGRVSDRQRAVLDAADAGSSRWTRVAALVMLLTIVGLGLVAIASTDEPPAAAFVALAVVAGVAIGLFALSAIVGRRRFADVRAGRVSVATGRAKTKEKRTTSEYGGVTIYRLKIGSTKFSLSNADELAAFVDGADYQVFYVKAPGSPILLSADAIT